MSRPEEDSVTPESDSENTATVEMFQCRKCPGKLFTAAEKDNHRQMHRQNKNKSKPSGRPQTAIRSGGRAPSPATSGVTLFQPVSPSQSQDTPRRSANVGTNKRGRGGDETPKPRKKIRSVKHRNEAVSYNTTTGG